MEIIIYLKATFDFFMPRSEPPQLLGGPTVRIDMIGPIADVGNEGLTLPVYFSARGLHRGWDSWQVQFD